jgi:hypothetical protein
MARSSAAACASSRDSPRWYWGSLALGGIAVGFVSTVAGSLTASADGARHPATLASIVVAVIVLLGGPRLLAVVRHKVAQAVMPS